MFSGLVILTGLISVCHGVVPQNLISDLELGRSLQSSKDAYREIQRLQEHHSSSSSNISEPCQSHYQQLQLDKTLLQPYALQFMDSAGKLEAGILRGNIRWWGSYDQCKRAAKTNTEEEVIFSGKYCRLVYSVANMPVSIGHCFPDTCSDKDIQQIITSNTSLLQAAASCPSKPPLSTGDIVAIVLCSILALLLVAGTTADLIIERSYPNLKSGLLLSGVLSFSIVRNLPKLLSTKTRSGNIDCVNGIRVLSLLWVILGHSVLNTIYLANNPLDISYFVKDFDFQAINNGTVSVDTFFFLSGLLVCYLTLRQLEKNNGHLNWFLFYFHRFWRLTPVYMFTLMMTTTLLYQMTPDGPQTNNQPGPGVCQKYWWTNLLYINNFYPDLMSDMCVNWSWYLANDMQFYWISPLIIIPLYKWPKVGMGIIFALFAACSTARGVIADKYQLHPTWFGTVMDQSITDHYYIRPYYRIAPYLTGMVLGYFLWRRKLKIDMSWLVATIGWVAAAAINIGVLYGLYGYYVNENYTMDSFTVFYQTLHRWLWSLGVAWVVLACVANRAGWVDTLLSWKGWLPFVRLAYTAYLIHLPIMALHGYSIHDLLHLDTYTMVYNFLADAVLTFLVALVVSLAVESPMIGIEKVLLTTVSKLGGHLKHSTTNDDTVSGPTENHHGSFNGHLHNKVSTKMQTGHTNFAFNNEEPVIVSTEVEISKL